MNAQRIFLTFTALAVVALAFNAAPVKALVENQSFGIFGVTPVTAQPADAGQAALTDSTGGTAGTTLAAGTGVNTISIPVDLASVGNADLLTAYTPGYAFKILAVTFAQNAPVTTGSKLATITPKISGSAVTGGVLALTSATCTPMGHLIAGSTVTAANTGTATDTISLTGSSVTAFVEGSGTILIKLQNLDTANTAASLARQSTSWRSVLVALGLAKGSS